MQIKQDYVEAKNKSILNKMNRNNKDLILKQQIKYLKTNLYKSNFNVLISTNKRVNNITIRVMKPNTIGSFMMMTLNKYLLRTA